MSHDGAGAADQGDQAPTPAAAESAEQDDLEDDISVSDVSVSDVSVSDVSVSDSEDEDGGEDAEGGGEAGDGARVAVALPGDADYEDDEEEEENAALFSAGRPQLDLGVAVEEEEEVVEARAVLGSERGDMPEAPVPTGIDLIDKATAAVRGEPVHMTEDAVRFREFKLDQLEFWAREMARTCQLMIYRAHAAETQLKLLLPTESARVKLSPSLAQCLPCGQRRRERSKGLDNPALRDMPSPQLAALQLRERARVAYGGLLFLLREDPHYLSTLLRLQHTAVRQRHYDAGDEPLLSRAELTHVSRIVTTVLFGTRHRRTVSGGAAVSSVITPGGAVLPEAAKLEEEVGAEEEEGEEEEEEEEKGEEEEEKEDGGGRDATPKGSEKAEEEPAPSKEGAATKPRPAFLLPIHDEKMVQAHLEDLTSVDSGTPRVALASGGATLQMGLRGADRLTRLQTQIRRSVTSAEAAAAARSAARAQEGAAAADNAEAASKQGGEQQEQQQEQQEEGDQAAEASEGAKGGADDAEAAPKEGEEQEEAGEAGTSGEAAEETDQGSKVSELELLFAVTADVHLLRLCKSLLVDEVKACDDLEGRPPLRGSSAGTELLGTYLRSPVMQHSLGKLLSPSLGTLLRYSEALGSFPLAFATVLSKLERQNRTRAKTKGKELLEVSAHAVHERQAKNARRLAEATAAFLDAFIASAEHRNFAAVPYGLRYLVHHVLRAADSQFPLGAPNAPTPLHGFPSHGHPLVSSIVFTRWILAMLMTGVRSGYIVNEGVSKRTAEAFRCNVDQMCRVIGLVSSGVQADEGWSSLSAEQLEPINALVARYTGRLARFYSEVGNIEPDAQIWHRKTLLEAPAFLQRYWLRRAAPPELVELSRYDLLSLRDVLRRAICEPEEEHEQGERDVAEESRPPLTPQARAVGHITSSQRSASLRRELLQFRKGEALSIEEVKAARRVFELADRDANGQLTAVELSKALQAMNFSATSSDVKFMVSAADNNLDGGIDFSEFLRLMHSIRTRRSEAGARSKRAADRVGRLLNALDEEDPYEESDLHPEAAGGDTVLELPLLDVYGADPPHDPSGRHGPAYASPAGARPDEEENVDPNRAFEETRSALMWVLREAPAGLIASTVKRVLVSSELLAADEAEGVADDDALMRSDTSAARALSDPTLSGEELPRAQRARLLKFSGAAEFRAAMEADARGGGQAGAGDGEGDAGGKGGAVVNPLLRKVAPAYLLPEPPEGAVSRDQKLMMERRAYEALKDSAPPDLKRRRVRPDVPASVLTVHSGSHMPKMGFFDACNAYVEAALVSNEDGMIVKRCATEVEGNALNPQWEATFDLPPLLHRNYALILDAYHRPSEGEGEGEEDEFLGTATLVLSALSFHEVVTLPLEPRSHDAPPLHLRGGRVSVSLRPASGEEGGDEEDRELGYAQRLEETTATALLHALDMVAEAAASSGSSPALALTAQWCRVRIEHIRATQQWRAFAHRVAEDESRLEVRKALEAMSLMRLQDLAGTLCPKEEVEGNANGEAGEAEEAESHTTGAGQSREALVDRLTAKLIEDARLAESFLATRAEGQDEVNVFSTRDAAVQMLEQIPSVCETHEARRERAVAAFGAMRMLRRVLRLQHHAVEQTYELFRRYLANTRRGGDEAQLQRARLGEAGARSREETWMDVRPRVQEGQGGKGQLTVHPPSPASLRMGAASTNGISPSSASSVSDPGKLTKRTNVGGVGGRCGLYSLGRLRRMGVLAPQSPVFQAGFFQRKRMKVLFEPQGAQEFRVAVMMKRSVVMEGSLALEDLLAQRLRYQGTGRRMSAGEKALVRALSRGGGGPWAGDKGGGGVDPALAAKFGVIHMEELVLNLEPLLQLLMSLAPRGQSVDQ